MAQHLTDEEELQVLKNWWKENGRFLVIIVTLGLAAYVGWQWWQQYQQDYAEGAAAIYTELSETVSAANEEALTDEQQKTAQFLIEQLQNNYGRSLYAASASLLAGKLAVEKNDLPLAESELRKAWEQGDEGIKPLAGLRLARVYLAQEKLDEAMTIAAEEQAEAFASSYADLRGDIYLAQGDMQSARAAYQQALDTLPTSNSSFQRQLIEIKLADLAAGDQS